MMDKPFAPFSATLTRQQVSLLLDAALFFEDAPKLLSVPGEHGEPVPLPIVPDTLRRMLAVLDETDPAVGGRYAFDFSWTDHASRTGALIVTLPGGEVLHQPVTWDEFSPV